MTSGKKLADKNVNRVNRMIKQYKAPQTFGIFMNVEVANCRWPRC